MLDKVLDMVRPWQGSALGLEDAVEVGLGKGFVRA